MQTVAATALADFQAEDPVELSFKADEVLRIHNYPHEEPNAPGWYLAENAVGAKGIVPVSYVEVTYEDGEAEGEAGEYLDDEIRDGASDDQMFRGPFLPMGKGRMLADFVAEAEGEMSCHAGDLVELLRPAQGLPEGWLYARIGGAAGLVPETYVEPADEDGIGSTMGGAGDLSGLDLAGLETIGQSGDEYLDDGLDALEFGGGGVDAEHAGEGEIMIVLADFAAEDPKEMSCKAQELVRFVRRPPEALDWALCQRLQGGAEGLVPASYLRGADGQMVAGFTAEDAGEVSAPEGMKVWQAEPTPTSAAGWSLVVLETGEKGLVPESYVSWSGGAPPFGGGAAEERADWAAYGGELLEETDLEAEIEAAGGGGGGGGGDGGTESVSEWLAYTTVLVANADPSATLAAVALADFTAEAPVEMSIKAGERLALLTGVEPPRGWAIALRVGATDATTTKGLVPETYVQLTAFEALVSAPVAALGLSENDVVMVQPDRSTPDAWWVEGLPASSRRGRGLCRTLGT